MQRVRDSIRGCGAEQEQLLNILDPVNVRDSVVQHSEDGEGTWNFSAMLSLLPVPSWHPGVTWLWGVGADLPLPSPSLLTWCLHILWLSDALVLWCSTRAVRTEELLNKCLREGRISSPLHTFLLLPSSNSGNGKKKNVMCGRALRATGWKTNTRRMRNSYWKKRALRSNFFYFFDLFRKMEKRKILFVEKLVTSFFVLFLLRMEFAM